MRWDFSLNLNIKFIDYVSSSSLKEELIEGVQALVREVEEWWEALREGNIGKEWYAEACRKAVNAWRGKLREVENLVYHMSGDIREFVQILGKASSSLDSLEAKCILAVYTEVEFSQLFVPLGDFLGSLRALLKKAQATSEPEFWALRIAVGDTTYVAKLKLGDELILGRFDAEGGPSRLAVKAPEGGVLYVFQNTICKTRCVRDEFDFSKNDCTSSRHVVVRVTRGGLVVRLMKDKFPIYTSIGNLYREGDSVEIPPKKEVTMEISGVYLERATQVGRAQIKIILTAE